MAQRPGLPRFCGGLAGYFGYDAVRYIEKKLAHSAPPDDLDTARHPVAADRGSRGHRQPVGQALSDRLRRSDAGRGLHESEAASARTASASARDRAAAGHVGQRAHRDVTASSRKSDYLDAVRKAKEYIAAGDLMQVQVGQRLIKPYPRQAAVAVSRAALAESVALHVLLQLAASSTSSARRRRSWCARNSAPRTDNVTIRPLAGTRPRGNTPERDAELATELLNDPKEIAEHVMLIDLARNDIGRIAQTGSVVGDRQDGDREVLARAAHREFNVEGKLKPGMTNFDVLRATFPAGTLSGAPKVRAMELIDELEPVKRGLYGGACRLSVVRRRHGRGDRDPHRHRSRTAICTCRRRPASSPIRCRNPNGKRPRTRRARCCAPPSRCKTASIATSDGDRPCC